MEKLTRYEIARLIGARALEISMGAHYKVKITKKELEKIHYNPISIAEMEFKAGKLPLEVVRESSSQMEKEEKESENQKKLSPA
ncbi:MAG: DNA-directed RNA polymerase subunit K [Nitrospiraceae bacterium]|nr:DNA-directed RNA polymerase subunit K [Nitrospiraceae bacterium]